MPRGSLGESAAEQQELARRHKGWLDGLASGDCPGAEERHRSVVGGAEY